MVSRLSVDTQAYIDQLGRGAKLSSRVIAATSFSQRNEFLKTLSEELSDSRKIILKANKKDLVEAEKKGLNEALLDRLKLDDRTVDRMIDSVREIYNLPDPIGRIENLRDMPSGIKVGQMSVPIGVIGIIYESRPNVTIEAACLCVKAGNTVILRGGSEAISSNQSLAGCLSVALERAKLPVQAIQLVETTDRAAVGSLLKLSTHIDLIIPRGGKSLVTRVAEEAQIPVIKHLDGNCHLYLDHGVDSDMALKLAINSKTNRYGTCNTMETLLIADSLRETLLPKIVDEMFNHGVEVRGCERSKEMVPQISLASESDWYEEYLAPILAIRIVSGMEEAIEHISYYGSNHTDGIVTQNHQRAMRFVREIDSSSVLVNTSTRFADGFEYGLGAEIGISTDKFHARGPVGAEGLTSKKFVVLGNGEIRN